MDVVENLRGNNLLLCVLMIFNVFYLSLVGGVLKSLIGLFVYKN